MEKITNCPICKSTELSYFLTCKDYTVTGEDFKIEICNSCKLLITNPKPSETDLPGYYISSKYISHTGIGKNLVDRLYLMARSYTLTKKLKLINQHTKNVGGEKILEYGCGTGEFVNTCKSNDWMVSGVEPSLTARTKAQELTQQKIHSSLKELDAKDFHAITLWHVLEHVPDLENIVEKLTSKLKKDGTMFIAVPNHESYDAKYYGNIWAAYDVPRHLWHFSRKNITMLMERNGLRLKTITPMKLDSFYVSMLSESYRNNSASSISNFLKAMWIGMKSNQKAATSGNYSSLIYIFTK